MFGTDTNITEAQKKEFLKKYEDGLNEDKTKSALHSVDMSLSIFGGQSKISLLDRTVSRYVFYKLFVNSKVEAFFRRCAKPDTRITSKEFEEFESVCKGITSRLAQTSLELIFREGYKVPHTNVDLWIIESEWRDLTGRISWNQQVEDAVEQQMAGIFNHLERLTNLTNRTVDYGNIADELHGQALEDALNNEAFMEASAALLRSFIMDNTARLAK